MGLDESKHSSDLAAARTWIVPAVLLFAAMLIAFFGDAGREWLRYDRVWIGQGEIWRLLTGHLAHLGWPHFALNGAGLLLVWFLVGGTYGLRAWVLITFCIVATIDIAFWIMNPGLHWYVGLSGLLHGLLAAALVRRLRSMDAETLVLAALLVVKLAWEQFAGPVPGSELSSGGPVVVDAHLYGALGGLLGARIATIRVKPQAAI